MPAHAPTKLADPPRGLLIGGGSLAYVFTSTSTVRFGSRSGSTPGISEDLETKCVAIDGDASGPRMLAEPDGRGRPG